MTREEIIALANDAELCQCIWIDESSEVIDSLVAFAKLVANKERKACANLCENMALYTGVDCADAIRARGEA